MSGLFYQIENNPFYHTYSAARILDRLKIHVIDSDLHEVYFCIETEIKIAFFGGNCNNWQNSGMQDALIKELQKADKKGKYPELQNLKNEHRCHLDDDTKWEYYGWMREGIWGAVRVICGTSEVTEDDYLETIQGQEDKEQELKAFVCNAKRKFLKRLIKKVEKDILEFEAKQSKQESTND